jgi:hypothetical protein
MVGLVRGGTRIPSNANIGDRLYVGLATGGLQVHSFALSTSDEESDSKGLPDVKLLKTHNLSRRSIDQIGVLPETNQLVILAGKHRDQGVAELSLTVRFYGHPSCSARYEQERCCDFLASSDGTLFRDCFVHRNNKAEEEQRRA